MFFSKKPTRFLYIPVILTSAIFFYIISLNMDIFDIIGPIMIGPSSSHTAGAVRIGYLTRVLLAEPAIKARVYLHGSFAYTYKGHGTDRAIAAGIMGMKPENERIRNSLTLAKEQGLDITFEPIDIPNTHPNTALIELTGIDGKEISVQGSSIGGGNILITKINGKPVELSGKNPTLVVEYQDIPGRIAAITSVTAKHKINISQIHIGRDYRGGTATMCLQMDGLSVGPDLKDDILKIEHIYNVILIQPV